MKLIIQIPVVNEADTIGEVIADLPPTIPGVKEIEVLLIDDGCTDNTVSIARARSKHPITVVSHTSNKGLTTAYQTGVDNALRLGADLIVNTDGDHQYSGADIPRLVAPLLEGRADIVIGDRQTQSLRHFSAEKKLLQRLGSWVVRRASDTDVRDTVSGFRALNREAALRTFVTTDFSYTVENLIQAGKRRLTIVTVPITASATRPSRLHQGNWHFVKRQAAIIARTYATYEPLKTFSYIAALFFLPALVLLINAAYIFVGRRLDWLPQSRTNLQSLIVGGVLLVMAAATFLIGLLADRVGGNRRLLEEILYRVRAQEIAEGERQREIEARLARIECSRASDSGKHEAAGDQEREQR